jgi:two-component system chemotaxis sensor kinase CheA
LLSPEEMNEFNVEAFELLEKAETSLLALESGESLAVHFDPIFRAFHNLKGAAGMMELADLQAFVHKLESLLTPFKTSLSLPKEMIDLFLTKIDVTKCIIRGERFDSHIEVPGQKSFPATSEVHTQLPSALENSKARVASESEEKSTITEMVGSARDASQLEFFSECNEILNRIAMTLEKVVKSGARPELIDSLYRDVHSLKGGAFLVGYAQMGELSHALENCLDKLRESGAMPKPVLLDLIFKGTDILERIVSSLEKGSSENFKNEIDAFIPLLLEVGTNANRAAEFVKLTEIAKPTEVVESEKVSMPSKFEVEFVTSEPQPETETEKQELVSTIRVPVPLLDKLMTLVGEMVLVRNQVIQFSNKNDDLEFSNLSQRLNVVTGEIQGEMMKTRMQPIGNVLSKFQRVVRDLSKDLKKKIELQLEGSETELDKSLLEAVKDPLTHIIRNSCDHGIETPEERKAKGKPEGGTIKVHAFHEGGQVIVEIIDDGRGLHREKLIAKAIEKKILTPEKAEQLSDREAMNLIFAPGFSTAAQVTNVSGRGVGMDVVRSNVDQIGGAVELDSVPNKGTTIRLKIPLTLAIVPAMIVRAGPDRYAIPQIKLVELVRIEKGKGENQIEYLQGKPVVRLRGLLLPLLDLKQVLKFDNYESRKVTEEAEAINIVVLSSEKKSFGLIVDEIQDTADIVVKPLSRFLKSLAVYSGATVLGDGSIALILDVAGVANMAMRNSELSDNTKANELRDAEAIRSSEDSQEFLLFKVNAPTKHAVFLGYVHRLEEFDRSAIEFSGGQRVMRYRNAVMPIISLNKTLGYNDPEIQSKVVPVIVTQKSGKYYGIEVNEILDVLTTDASVDGSIIDREGILGNIMTQNEVIVVVDPHRCLPKNAGSEKAIASVLPQVTRSSSNSTMNQVTTCSRRILFAEDTAFFRKHVTGVLERAGYEVIATKNGAEALNELERKGPGYYGVVLSDIEMPQVNGYELATTIRKDSKWNSLPLIALTTKSDAKDREKGKRVGFTSYLEKLNTDELIANLSEIMDASRAAS